MVGYLIPLKFLDKHHNCLVCCGHTVVLHILAFNGKIAACQSCKSLFFPYLNFWRIGSGRGKNVYIWRNLKLEEIHKLYISLRCFSSSSFQQGLHVIRSDRISRHPRNPLRVCMYVWLKSQIQHPISSYPSIQVNSGVFR